MAYDKRYVGGGLNTDDAWEVVPNGWVIFSKNMHLREGVKRQNVKGNSQVTSIDIPLSTFGVYTCIGAKEDPISNSVIYFLHHTELDHRILQYHNKTNSIETILQEQPGSPLNFNVNSLITGINIVYIDTNNPLLYWTDDFNRPRELNIAAAKIFSTGDFTGYYSSPFLSNFIDAIKYPPLYPPTISYSTDTSRVTNNLKTAMFEAKYRYVFFDGQKSAFSPISEVSLPTQYSNIYMQPIADDLENNVLEISGAQGASNVIRIEVAIREGNIGDFYIAGEFDRSIATATDAPFTFNFYNDQVLIPIEINESIKLFDNLPQLAKAQDYIKGNRIVYGNIVEGYDNVPIDVTMTPVYNERPQATVTSGSPNCTFISENRIINPTTGPLGNFDGNAYDGFVMKYDFNFGTYLLPVIGDIVTIDFEYYYKMSRDNSVTGANETWVYPDFRSEGNQRNIFAQVMVRDAGGGVAETLAALLDRLVEYLNVKYGYLNPYYKNNSGADAEDDMFNTFEIRNRGEGDNDKTQGMRLFRRNGFLIQMADSTHDPCQISIALPQLQIDDIIENETINSSQVTRPLFQDYTSFKAGAQHPFGIVYYDNANRSGGTNVNDNSIVVTEWYNETTTAGGLGKIDIEWEVKHLPPDWATKWSWVYAKNTTVRKFVQFAITSWSNPPFSPQTTTSEQYPDAYLVSYQEIPDYIKTILTANQMLGDAGENLSYFWAKGDRIRIVGAYNAGVFVKPPGYIDAEILGTTIIDNINYLIIRQNINDAAFTSENMVFEIFNTTLDSNDRVYYEFGEQYPVLNPYTATRSHGGQIQNQDPNQPATVPATGIFTKGDVYFKQRAVVGRFSTAIIYVEDYNFLDYVSSANYNKGRPNRELKGAQRYRKQTMMPYSGRFIENTNINNLNSFFDGAFEEYEQKYGSIQKLAARDTSLVCYQELKVGNILINERVVANPNVPIVGQTDNVLNPIVYYAGDYGIGTNPESWARFGYADYFVDVHRGSILRLSTNGIESISYLYKINDDITTLFGNINAQTTRVNMFGVFNKRRMQYELAIKGASFDQTLAFDEKNNVFSGYFDYLPENMCSINQDILSFVNGRAWLHEANALYNNFYGVQYDSHVWIVANIDPSEEKVFLALSEESSHIFEVEFTNNKGQLSNLIASDFVNNEGIFYAALLNDINTPNKNNPLLNGDSMRDVLLVIKLTNSDTSLVGLYAVNVNSTASLRSNF